MKKLATIAILIVFAAQVAFAQVNPRGKVNRKVGQATISIDHGEPSLRGRDVRSMITPGQLWRLGADDNTTMTTDRPIQLAGKQVPSGKYTLVVRFVEKEKWNLLVLSKGDAFDFDPSGVVVEVPLTMETVSASVERLVISVTPAGKFEIAWGTLKAAADVKAGGGR